MRRANSPSAKTPSIPGNGNLSNLAVLLVSLPQVVLVGFKHHIAYEKTVAGLLAARVTRFCYSAVRAMSLFTVVNKVYVETLLEAYFC